MTDQPIPRKVTRWICPHCTRGWASRRRAAEHIGICYRVPLPDHPIRDGRKLLMLHCGRWEANT